MPKDPQETVLTVREVARRLRVDDTTVRRWIKSGALEAITLPHRGNSNPRVLGNAHQDPRVRQGHLRCHTSSILT
jgi:excisionase family DNA binding protein